MHLTPKANSDAQPKHQELVLQIYETVSRDSLEPTTNGHMVTTEVGLGRATMEMAVIRAETTTAATDKTINSTITMMILRDNHVGMSDHTPTMLIKMTMLRTAHGESLGAMINMAMINMAMTLLQTTFQTTPILVVLHFTIVVVVDSFTAGANVILGLNMDSTVVIVKRVERPTTLIVIISTAIANSGEETISLKSDLHFQLLSDFDYHCI